MAAASYSQTNPVEILRDGLRLAWPEDSMGLPDPEYLDLDVSEYMNLRLQESLTVDELMEVAGPCPISDFVTLLSFAKFSEEMLAEGAYPDDSFGSQLQYEESNWASSELGELRIEFESRIDELGLSSSDSFFFLTREVEENGVQVSLPIVGGSMKLATAAKAYSLGLAVLMAYLFGLLPALRTRPADFDPLSRYEWILTNPSTMGFVLSGVLLGAPAYILTDTPIHWAVPTTYSLVACAAFIRFRSTSNALAAQQGVS